MHISLPLHIAVLSQTVFLRRRDFGLYFYRPLFFALRKSKLHYCIGSNKIVLIYAPYNVKQQKSCPLSISAAHAYNMYIQHHKLRSPLTRTHLPIFQAVISSPLGCMGRTLMPSTFYPTPTLNYSLGPTVNDSFRPSFGKFD